MHIEANYSHSLRSQRRLHGGTSVNNYHSDSLVKPSIRRRSNQRQNTTVHSHPSSLPRHHTEAIGRLYSSMHSSVHTLPAVEPFESPGEDELNKHRFPNFAIDERTNSKKQPGSLPPYVVNKLRERFEKRVLRQHQHPQKISETSEKYLLVAAFLVDGGVVEAWHIYAPIPMDDGNGNEGEVTSRTVELTQRRTRLLQRYYSGARQYVILYVNSNRAEHYLPMGLATGSQNRKTSMNKKLSEGDSPFGGHRVITRLFSSVLHTPHGKRIDSSEVSSEAQTTHYSGKPLRREHSLPNLGNYNRTNEDDEDASSPISTTSAGRFQSRGSSFIRRLLDHLRRTSVHKTRSLPDKKSSEGGEFKTSSEDFNDKDSSSSGLIDFSSTGGSTFSYPARRLTYSRKKEEREKFSSDVTQLNEQTFFEEDTFKDDSADKRDVWLPKIQRR